MSRESAKKIDGSAVANGGQGGGKMMVGSDTADGETTLKGAKLTLAVLAAAWLMAFLDRAIIALLATGIKTSLHVSEVEIGVLQGFAFSAIYILVALPVGWLADRSNRRNILLFGVCCWSLATMACGLATTYHELVLGRAMVGLGEACLGPPTVSLVADYFRARARGRAMGVVTAAAAVGTAGSLVLGGLILKLCGGKAVAIPLIGMTEPWQVTFMVLGAPGLLVALALFAVKEPQRQQLRAQAIPGGGAGTGFHRVLLSRWQFFLLVYLALGCSVFSGFGGNAWMPTVAIRSFGLEASYVGLVMGSIALTISSFSPLVVGAISDWASVRRPGSGRLWTIAVLFVVQLPLTAAWAFLPVSFPVFLALTTLNGIANGGLSSSGHVVLQELAPNHRAQAISIFTILSSFVGMGGGPLVIALITTHVFQDEMMIRYSVAIVALLCTSLGLLSVLSAIGNVRNFGGRSGADIGGMAERA
jgi:MFS family permease